MNRSLHTDGVMVIIIYYIRYWRSKNITVEIPLQYSITYYIILIIFDRSITMNK